MPGMAGLQLGESKGSGETDVLSLSPLLQGVQTPCVCECMCGSCSFSHAEVSNLWLLLFLD